MKVAIVINTSWNIYNFRRGLLNALKADGHAIYAVAPEDAFSQKLEEEGYHFVPVVMDNKGSNPLKDLLLYRQLKKAYKKISPDIILHYTIKPNIYGTLAAHRLKIPCINNVSGLGTVFIRKNIVSRIAMMLYQKAFKYPQKVFFQNEDDRQLFIEKRLVRKEITGVLPGSGVDLDKFTPSPYKRNQPFTFLMIARLLVDKGVREYAEAAGMVQAKLENKNEATFQLLGFRDFDNKLSISEEQLTNWTAKKWIDYLGGQEDVRPFIEQADVVVLPSYREGTPKTLLEAAAMGKPIITTNVPGCKEVVKNEENGFLCRAKDSDDLAEKCFAILKADDDALKQMGQKSRERAESVFDEKIVIKRYKEELKKVDKA